MKMNLISLASAALIALCACNPAEESKPVYEKPLKNPTKVALEQTPFSNVVTVTWQDNCDTELGYNVWLKAEGKDAAIVATLDPDTETYTLAEGLTAGASYNIGIQAKAGDEKLCSGIIYKSITLFDYAVLPRVVIDTTSVAYTPTSVAVNYKFKQNKDYQILSYGLCWSKDGVPTIEDAHAPGPKASKVTLTQAITCASMDYKTDYQVRGYAETSLGYVYSDEIITVNLGDQQGYFRLQWDELSFSGMPEDIKVYKTKDGATINGRKVQAWYAIADVAKGNVEFRFDVASSGKTLEKWYTDDNYVMTNAGYFNMSSGAMGDYHTINGVVSQPLYAAVCKGGFGVDENQNPRVFWAARSESKFMYYYDAPMPNIYGVSEYNTCDYNYPSTSFDYNPYYAMCAGPLLVKDNKIMIDLTKENGYFVRNYETIASDIYTDSSVTPDRTAVGYTEDGKIILFVIDGRIEESKGASILEMAQVMKGLGCVGAVNFDGGGSTAMTVFGTRQNSLKSNMSGGTENRAVSSVMGFYKKTK